MSLVAKFFYIAFFSFFSIIAKAEGISILVIGQSISANCNEHAFKESAGIYQIGLDGLKKPARDPFEFSDCKQGSMWIPLGERIIHMGLAKEVTFMPLGVNGSSIGEWREGGSAFQKLTDALILSKKNSIFFDYVFFHQGSSDAGRPPLSYRSDLLKVLKFIKINFNIGKILIATHSKCGNLNDPKIALQQKIVSSLHQYHYFPGPDNNSLGNEYRFDGCHLNKAGQEEMANRWLHSMIEANSIQSKFDKEILIKIFR